MKKTDTWGEKIAALEGRIEKLERELAEIKQPARFPKKSFYDPIRLNEALMACHQGKHQPLRDYLRQGGRVGPEKGDEG